MMNRAVTLVAMMLMAAALVSAAPVAGEAKPKEEVRAWVPTRDKLRQRVTLEAIEANTPLKEALAFVSEKYGLTIVLNTEAFKEQGIMEPENYPVKLDKLGEVRLENWLDRLLATATADYYVQPDGIISVVPQVTIVKHILGQKVSLSFEKKAAGEALRQLGDTMGLSIIVDEKRAGDKAKTPVTADLRNVSLESAILILADLAELKPVTIDRAVYVTTVENAKNLNAELEKKKETGEEPKPPQQ